ncbi:radical SAM protein [Dissulfurispira thermophila]|uniref:Radical SAM protein n=2 Tax=root TaxID=1 RepID=A0A7G1H023_9BACT|nr:radical SAM protein [Dissulfurispira thermophila]BCB95868.1 radical SAM protein [Dissulfurispira thermophila]
MNRRLIEKVDTILSKEKGTIFKDPGGKINICLVYPDAYHIGMSNLGFQGIYSFLNRRDDVVCERAFLPDERDIGEYIRTETSIFSYESKRSLNRFDIVAFSISFENDYPNILKALNIAKIPFSSSERNEYHPLLIAGGVCCFFNPEPIAPIFDIIFVGEAEDSLNEFIDKYKVKGKGQKGEIKRELSNIEGIYVPEFYQVAYNNDGTIAERISLNNAPKKIKRRYIKDLSVSPVTTTITTPEAEFSDMYLIEAMRGCPWKCRFCLVGHIYSPPRKKDLTAITTEINRAKEITSKIGLIGPSLTDYAHIKDVLSIEDVDFSITSLRASEKSVELVALLKGHKSVSIAPEAGTERMRRVVNKKITEKDILDTSSLILNAGIENLRLYFIIGLPSETQEDVSGIVELVKKARRLSNRGNIILSISTFVPKPFTPFQWHAMEPLDSIKEKLKFIKKALKDEKGVKVFHDVPKYAYMQGLFSMGDRRVFNVLKAMVKTDDYKAACSEAGVDMDYYIFREKNFDEILPWDFIDTGISKEKLWNEYIEAMSV